MTDIILNEPVPSSGDLERLHLFPGRHLGEEEFDRLQAYADRRLLPLLASVEPGIIHGLNIKISTQSLDAEGFTVTSGLAVAGNGKTLGLYYPLRQTWRTLIENYVAESRAASAVGIYYLTLKRSERYIDADPDVDPCQRTEFDPTRDSRLVVAGTLSLKRLAIATDAVTTQTRERIANWVAANNVGGEFLRTMENAVPLGLMAIEQTGTDEGGAAVYGVRWFSEAAGRYLAQPNSGYEVLLNQTREAFHRIMNLADESETSLEEFLGNNLEMDFLPAAGQLPIEFLQDPALLNPRALWLPDHLRVDMVAVAEESVSELIKRHLPRTVVDLRQPAGDHIRLMVAVNEPDYSSILLNYPQTDAELHNDVFRYFMRAYNIWRDWIDQFNQLYFLTEEDVLSEGEIDAIGLPDAIDNPQIPESVFDFMIKKAVDELAKEGDPTPYPYNQGVPAYPEFYRAWGTVNNSKVLPPEVKEPDEDGLVIQYAVARNELEAIDNEIRTLRSRLEKTRDYILLQRQQLDNQTVSLASLAGGVAGDGSGLQVARWLPFANLKQQSATSIDGKN